jgi:hypothetical protein
MSYTMSVTCSLRADDSVNSPRISVNSIATADTSVKADVVQEGEQRGHDGGSCQLGNLPPTDL